MITIITDLHKQRLKEIRNSLNVIGYKEGSFLQVELLFYEALTISRTYGNDPDQNILLAAFKKLQSEQYEKTKELTRKSSQREKRIRGFIFQFKKILSGIYSIDDRH
ncbi:MAG: hypothetical protein ICV66_06705 [Chitinophagaceae bacterium]|nr:hypothetical protein [Chitinophagaceae bacterium]